jgi:hypothetical protein
MTPPHQFTFGVAGALNLTATTAPAPNTYQEAMGGLGTTTPGRNFPGTSYPTPYNTTMIGEGVVDSTHRVLFTLSYTFTGDKAYAPDVSQYMVSDAVQSGCSPLTGTGPVPGAGPYPKEISLFWNDGAASISLALKDPSSKIQTLVSGWSNAGVNNNFVNNFLILNSTLPRPATTPTHSP